MKLLLFPISVAALGLTVTVNAQDTTVKSRTQIKADDAKVTMMTGCLRQDALSGTYTLIGVLAAAGNDLTTKSKTRTDVNKNDVSVKSKTKTTADDGAVATTGALSTYVLVPASNVDLAANVGHQVRVSSIMVEGGHGDADVKIKDETTVDPEHASASTSRSKSKIEVPKSPFGSYNVVSITSLADTCATP
jgi:hypothetical protein